MATLQKIRNRGALLVTILGIALLAFILGDLLTSGSTLFGKAKDKAFVVNGEVISTGQFSDKIGEFEEFQKMISGQTSLDENMSMQIRNAVYQQMVRERLINSQARKLGLNVSKEEVNDMVHGEAISPILQQLPFFVDQQSGLFSREALREFLTVVKRPTSNPQEESMISRYKSLWLFIENMIKTQRLQEKYVSLLSHIVSPNDVEAKNSFDLSQQNADIEYVMQSYFSIPDSTVSITESEIKAYYDKHKKTFRLEAPLVKLSYFSKQIVPSAEDVVNVENESKKAFEELQNSASPASVVANYSESPYRDVFVSEQLLTPSQIEFVRSAPVNEMYGPKQDDNFFHIYKLMDKTIAPDSIHLNILIIPDASIVGQDSTVTHLMDSIYNEIEHGTSFTDVANSFNSGSNGGDAGWVREVDLISLGADAVKTFFNAPVGKTFKMNVPGRQMIYKVVEKTKPIRKYKLAVINMPILASEKTSNNVDNELNQLISNPDIKQKFNELASEKGYMVMPNITVSANDFTLAQIPGTRQIITWAANEKKMGSVKKFDLSNQRVVARVEQVIPAGFAPLSETSTAIRARLLNEKKAEKIMADLKAKNLTSLEQYAEAMHSKPDTVRFVNFTTPNITGLGFEPVMNAVSAFAPLQTTSQPLKGNMGVIVANVTNRTEGTEMYNAKEQKTNMANNAAYRIQMEH